MGIIQHKAMAKRRKRETKQIEFANFKGGIRTDVVESVLPMAYAKKMYNFCIKNGALTTGVGVNKLKLPYIGDSFREREVVWDMLGQPFRLFLFRGYNNSSGGSGDRLVCANTDGALCTIQINSSANVFSKIQGVNCGMIPRTAVNLTGIDGKDYFVFGSTGDDLRRWSPSLGARIIMNGPYVVSLCMHYERVFAIIRNRETYVWYHNDPVVDNWEFGTGEQIELVDKINGSAKNLISFNNYLYIIRDYGITRLTAYANEADFQLRNIYTSSNYIYADSACVCGEYIYFMATDGLHIFDGVNVRRIKLGFEDIILDVRDSPIRGTYINKKYCVILDTNLSETDRYYCNSLFIYDTTTGEYDLFTGCYFKDIISAVGEHVDKLIALIKTPNETGMYRHTLVQIDNSGQFLGEPTEKVWESPFSDLGYSNYEKSISRISLQTKTECKVILETEKDILEISFKGANKVQSKKINMCGVMLKITFISNQSVCEISHPKITFSLGKPNNEM